MDDRASRDARATQVPMRARVTAVAGALAVFAGGLFVLAGGCQGGGGDHPAARVAAPVPGGTIVFARNTGHRGSGLDDTTNGLFAMRPKQGRVRRLVQGRVCCVSWSSRAGRLALSVAAPSNLASVASMHPDGSGLVTLHHPASMRFVPGAWSADGLRLILQGWAPGRSGKDGIYSSTPGGGQLVRIVRSSNRRDRPLSVSPDGSRLLFARRVAGNDALMVAATTAGRPIRLTPAGGNSWCCYFGQPASWSPDGSRIAFAAFVPGETGDDLRSAVFVADRDGGHDRRITDWGDGTTSAHWSPDGRWIVFDRVARASGGHDLFVVHPDGSAVQQIPTGPDAGSCCAIWSPDSSTLLYEHGPDGYDIALYRVPIEGPVASVRLSPPGHYMSFMWVSDTR